MSKAKDAPTAPPAEIIPPSESRTARAKAALAAKLGIPTSDVERDPEMEGLMAEIEADLREKELRQIWQRYGKYMIAALVLGVLVVIGYQSWREHEVNERLAIAARYDAATKAMDEGKTDEALAIFADLAKHPGEGYGALAQLQRASVLLAKNDVDGAIGVYKELAASSQADATLRDLALLLQAMHSVDRVPPKDLEVLIAPLLNPGNAFNPTALELSAVLAAKEGDTARAAKIVDQILAEPSTPPSLRRRAQDLAIYYKSLAPAAAPAAPKPEQH